MGVSNLWDALRPASERKPLQPLAASYYCGPKQRKLKIGVDASIWLKQCTVSVGSNPIYPHLPLQAFFYKLIGLYNAGLHVLLVFDGPDRPKMKRGKFVRGYGMPNEKNVQRMADAFGFNWVRAPAEAEAELAVLQKRGDVDLILSDDADTLVFGASWVMRNHSKNLSGTGAQSRHDRENNTTDHEAFYTLFRADRILEETRLTHGGMVLIALMSGGDYEPAGVENCGHVVSQALARCGFGDELLEAYDSLRWAQFDEFQMFLDGWRERIRNELRTNSQGEMSRKASTLASKLPDSFPVLETLDNYIQPITTLNRPDAIKLFEWNRPLDLQGLVEFVTEKLIWDHKMFLSRFQSERGIFAGLILNDLIARQPGVVLKLARDRSHPSTAFQHEYRVEFDPTTYVSRLQNSLIHPDPNEERVQEMRQKARAAAEDKQDSTSEAEAEDEAEAPKATKVKKSEAKNLLWLPAAVLRRAVPDLVEDFEQNKVDKQKKKEAADARKAAKARGEKPSPAKRKQSKGATKKVTSTQGSNAASPSRCLQGSTIKEGTQSGIAQPSSPVLSSRSSPTLDEMFLSQSSKSQKSATLSVISSQNVVDLCSSPEITKVMPKSSQAQESPCKPPSGLSQTSIRAREVSKTPSVHVLPKKRPQVQDLDLSSSDEDDDLLPTLPDPENIEIRLSKMLPKGKATQGSGTLGFRSTKATVSTTSTAKPVDASHRSKPKARGKPAYIEIDSD